MQNCLDNVGSVVLGRLKTSAPWENDSLGLQIGFQTLLYLIQKNVVSLECLQQV